MPMVWWMNMWQMISTMLIKPACSTDLFQTGYLKKSDKSHRMTDSKEGLTVLFCSNMPGTDKFKLLVIGKSE